MTSRRSICLVAAAVTAAPALAADISLDPRATYLRVNSDPALNAPAIALADLALAPGDYVRMQSLGDWDNGPGADVATNIIAVFSSDDVLLPGTEPHRVPGAIDAGFDFQTGGTFHGNLPTDIPEDFAVTVMGAGIESVLIRIPENASHLFAAAGDSLYFDNSDPDGDYALRIEHVLCPADIDGDGSVTSLDFITFLNAWTAADPIADFDSNGEITTQDVLTFLNLWVAGC